MKKFFNFISVFIVLVCFSGLSAENNKYAVSKAKKRVIDGIAVIESSDQFTFKGTGKFYQKPDFDSDLIYINQLDWKKYNSDKTKTVTLLNSSYQLEPFEGLCIYSYEKSLLTFTHDGITEHWYHVQIWDYNSVREMAWVFGGDVENYDYSKRDEYAKKILELGVQKKIIKLETFDTSNLPKNMKFLYLNEDETQIWFNDEKILMVMPFYDNGAYAEFDRSNLYVDSDGFTKLKLGNKEYLIIDGQYICQYFTNFQTDGENSYTNDSKETDRKYHSYYFKNISASSSFSEKIKGQVIKYEPENLYRCFEIGCKCHPYWWNYSHIPWVEGADGNGVGESVTIEFTKDMSGCSILNGYSDINNMKLYKENSRVKQLLVEDLVHNTSQLMDFEDRVYFNYIKFDQPTTKVRLTINSVYEGSKYTDTCISAILPSLEPAANHFVSQYSLIEVFRDYVQLTPSQILKVAYEN